MLSKRMLPTGTPLKKLSLVLLFSLPFSISTAQADYFSVNTNVAPHAGDNSTIDLYQDLGIIDIINDTRLNKTSSSGAKQPQSTAIGLAANADGTANTAVGAGAGFSSSGYHDTYIGTQAGAFVDNGTEYPWVSSMGNTAVGYKAGAGTKDNRRTRHQANVFVGEYAGYADQAGENVIGSVGVGYQAGKNANTNAGVDIGYQTGINSNGTGNVNIGAMTGQNISGSNNVGIGTEARQNARGSWSVAVGYQAGKNTSGSNHIAIGNGAGKGTTRVGNTAIGHMVGQNVNGLGNFGAGWRGTGTNVEGDYNVGLGVSTGHNFKGNANVAIGHNSGMYSEGNNNIALGRFSGNYNTGSNNIALGYQANNTTSSQRVAMNDTIAIGSNTQTTVDTAVALGSQSVADRAASNVAVDGVVLVPIQTQSQVYGMGTTADRQAIADTVVGDLAALSVGNEQNTRQIIHVAAGSEDTDAVNVAQLRSVGNAVGSKIEAAQYALQEKIGDTDERARTGVTSAMAMATLPQASTPGKSMVAWSVANYRGENALAVGVSTVSDNNKWVIKGAASVNRRDVGVSIGTGFQW